MIGRAVGEFWRYGRTFTATEADGSNERRFFGFMETVSPEGERATLRTKAGLVPAERFRLIAEPREGFVNGLSTRVFYGDTEYKLLGIRKVFAGARLSHRECIMRKAVSDA